MFKIREKFILWKIYQGKIDAFEEIYDYYAPKIYRFVYFRVSSVEDAEDLVSQIFIKLLKSLTRESGREVNNLQAFIYSIARNLVTDFYRQKKIVIAFDDKIKNELIDSKRSIENLNLSIDFSIEINNTMQAVKGLEDNCQEIIILRFVNDLSIKEIAIILGKSSGSIKVSLHRAIKKLRTIINNNL